MIIKGASPEQIQGALDKANESYSGNLQFNNYQPISKARTRVTLRVRDSKGPGARVGFSGRRLINACWHAHGVFLDALPEGAAVFTAGHWTRPGAEWRDWNAGSMARPAYLSELCHCG